MAAEMNTTNKTNEEPRLTFRLSAAEEAAIEEVAAIERRTVSGFVRNVVAEYCTAKLGVGPEELNTKLAEVTRRLDRRITDERVTRRKDAKKTKPE